MDKYKCLMCEKEIPDDETQDHMKSLPPIEIWWYLCQSCASKKDYNAMIAKFRNELESENKKGLLAIVIRR